MRYLSNYNHDKFKKKAVEEEVDVSVLVFFPVLPTWLSDSGAG